MVRLLTTLLEWRIASIKRPVVCSSRCLSDAMWQRSGGVAIGRLVMEMMYGEVDWETVDGGTWAFRVHARRTKFEMSTDLFSIYHYLGTSLPSAGPTGHPGDTSWRLQSPDFVTHFTDFRGNFNPTLRKNYQKRMTALAEKEQNDNARGKTKDKTLEGQKQNAWGGQNRTSDLQTGTEPVTKRERVTKTEAKTERKNARHVPESTTNTKRKERTN